eukprot:GEMP01105711.1.p1 GENE.GEMP01105711.1~~GEMP01105711.1.p1  ORF type:complete len:118 (+),score=27.98 GEMP01105711.1:59-412(+)
MTAHQAHQDFLFSHDAAEPQVVDPMAVQVKIDGVDIHDVLRTAKTGALLFGGLLSKSFGMGIIGFLAYQALQANKQYAREKEMREKMAAHGGGPPPFMQQMQHMQNMQRQQNAVRSQ